jgi:hypothetical protein
MSLTNWRMTNKFTTCSARATAPRGGCSSAHEIRVASTTIRDAPSLTAHEIGVLLATPPSIDPFVRRRYRDLETLKLGAPVESVSG